MTKKDAWTKGYQKTQAEYLAQLKRESENEKKTTQQNTKKR